jgi:hypothetical protein
MSRVLSAKEANTALLAGQFADGARISGFLSLRGKDFKLVAEGDEITVETSLMEPDYTEHEPLPERAALTPMIRQACLERAAAQNDGRGLWTSGVLYLQYGAHAFIAAEWE